MGMGHRNRYKNMRKTLWLRTKHIETTITMCLRLYMAIVMILSMHSARRHHCQPFISLNQLLAGCYSHYRSIKLPSNNCSSPCNWFYCFAQHMSADWTHTCSIRIWFFQMTRIFFSNENIKKFYGNRIELKNCWIFSTCEMFDRLAECLFFAEKRTIVNSFAS